MGGYQLRWEGKIEPFGIDVWIRDESAAPDKQFLHFHSSRTRDEVLHPVPADYKKSEMIRDTGIKLNPILNNTQKYSFHMGFAESVLIYCMVMKVGIKNQI